MSRTRIKICGVTRPEDAELAAELGADFIGLNFHPESPRFVAVAGAREIAARVRDRSRLVGVFVNATQSTIEAIAGEVGLDLLQFHGDEGPSEIAPFAERAIKVLRLDGPPAPGVLEEWSDVWGFLIEGRLEHLYGGGGMPWAYEMIGSLPRVKRVFVAGGLRPETVGAAVASTGAWGVDVASGVERSPGVKDDELMRRFFSEVRRIDGEKA